VLELRTVSDQEEQLGRRQALHEAIEEGVGFSVDPVQVLEDQEQWLRLAFPEEQTLESFQDLPATLRGLKAMEWAIRWEHLK
jgi:hypothetical protein